MKPWDAATTRDQRSNDLNLAPPAFATLREIRYADELRQQLRVQLLDVATPPLMAWSVGVD